MAFAVTTRSYDNRRSGANTHETALTPGAVRQRGLKRLLRLRLIGDARGAEAQPLVVPGVTLEDGSTREVVYLATMANQIWAYDAADGRLIWEKTLGRPVKGSQAIDLHNINDHWGILSTPVIDEASQLLYAVGWSSPDGTVTAADHVLYAVRLRDGQLAHPPLSLDGATFEPGHGLPTQRFDSAARKQRAGLLLLKAAGKTMVLAAFGSVRETDASARGWVIVCDVDAWRLAAAWATTARGFGAGIWQAGAGLVADEHGFVYAMTGNGSFDAITEFAESFVKLRLTVNGAAAALSLEDWWTPWTDAARVGHALAAPDGEGPPTNFRAVAAHAGADGWDDMDLGSGGPVVVPSANAVVGAGKDGVVYVLDRDHLGKTAPGDLGASAGNYAKLRSPPIFFTYFPGFDHNPAPANIQELNFLSGNRTHHQHGSPVHWESPDLGPVLYCWGENENLRAWAIDASGKVTYLARGAEQASIQAPVPPGGMPGGMLTLSANNATPHTGIVWATIPYQDANTGIGPGRLLAYDATQFGTFADGGKQLRVLWDSEKAGVTFVYNKFNPPIVANGRLYVPTYDGQVDVYVLA
jgi:outer membrane protein assembly factor BamB